MDAFETLMDEHRQIERILGSLETFATRLEQGADPSLLSGFVEFLRGFADRTHHGKEEEILFSLLIARGMSREAGPIAVMLHDHDQGRGLVSVLARASEAADAFAPAERQEAVRAARRFVALLRHHIYKEDTILFPMARGSLRPSDQRRLDWDFAAFDQGSGAASLRQLAARLAEDFPPMCASLEASEPVGNGCDLHCTIAGCPVRNPWDEPMFLGY